MVCLGAVVEFIIVRFMLLLWSLLLSKRSDSAVELAAAPKVTIGTTPKLIMFWVYGTITFWLLPRLLLNRAPLTYAGGGWAGLSAASLDSLAMRSSCSSLMRGLGLGLLDPMAMSCCDDPYLTSRRGIVVVAPIVSLWTMTCLAFWDLIAFEVSCFLGRLRGDYLGGEFRLRIVTEPSARISYGFESRVFSIEFNLDFESVPTVLRWVFTWSLPLSCALEVVLTARFPSSAELGTSIKWLRPFYATWVFC